MSQNLLQLHQYEIKEINSKDKFESCEFMDK